MNGDALETGPRGMWYLLLLPLPLIVLAVWVWPRFDGLYGQDPYAYYGYAIGPLRDSLVQGEPWPPFFWPPGYPLAIALVSFLSGSTPRTGQWISLIAAALTPIFTYLLAREVWRNANGTLFVALWAGLLVAFTGQLWQSAMVMMADTMGLALATASMACAAHYGRNASSDRLLHGLWLILAAVLMACAVLTRWAYALVAIPLTIYALAVLWRNRSPRRLLTGALAASAALAVLWPIWGPSVSAYLAGDGPILSFAGDLHAYSWHPANAFRREFITTDGLLRHRFPNGLWYALAPAHRYYFTPLLAIFLLPGLWTVWRHRRITELWLIVGWAAVIYLFHAGAHSEPLWNATPIHDTHRRLAHDGLWRMDADRLYCPTQASESGPGARSRSATARRRDAACVRPHVYVSAV